jgi:hypothetical protein
MRDVSIVVRHHEGVPGYVVAIVSLAVVAIVWSLRWLKP